MNLHIYEKGYYGNDNHKSIPKRIACLKLGCTDTASSQGERSIEKRINEHENGGWTRSIPLFIWERPHPKELEAKLLVILTDQKLRILHVSNAKVKNCQECFPISYDILEIIFENVNADSSIWIDRDGDIDQIHNDDDLQDFVNDRIDEYLQNFANNYINDLQEFDDTIILDNVNDSLSSKNCIKIEQNSILGTY